MDKRDTWARPIAVAAFLLAMACQKSLPTAPSELTEGIIVYEHANFVGRSAHIVTDARNLEDFSGPCEHTSTDSNGNGTTVRNWGDCISSVRVAPGWQATLYRDDGYRGQTVETTEDLPNLQLVAGTCSHDGLNDCVSSIRVRQR